MSLDDTLAPPTRSSREESIPATSCIPRIPLPILSEDNIEAYFYSLDFWFEASGIIADYAKFNIVAASIPQRKLMDLRPMIDAAPSTGKYQYIRKKLTEYLTESHQRRFQRVLREMPLGDRRPSDLFNEMKRAAGSTLSESILHDLWVNRLPAYAQAAIIASNVPISEKFKIADSIFESIQLREGRVNEACGIQNNSDSDIRNKIATLTQRLDKALDNRKTHYRSRSKTPAHHRKSDNGSDDMCWYHRKFGQDANRCRLPCNSLSTTKRFTIGLLRHWLFRDWQTV